MSRLLTLFQSMANAEVKFLSFLCQVLQTRHGEEEARAHQREPGPAEGAHPARAEERRKEDGQPSDWSIGSTPV